MSQVPQMTLRGFNLNSALVEWEDETHTYFVWVHHFTPQDWASKTSKEKRAVGPRGRMMNVKSLLDLNAKKNAGLKAAIHALATREAVQAAIDAEVAREEAAKTARDNDRRLHRLRDAVQTIIGAEHDDLIGMLREVDEDIADAVKTLWGAGQ